MTYQFTFQDIIDYLYDTRRIDILDHIVNSNDPLEKAFLLTITSIKYRWEWIDVETVSNVIALIANVNDVQSLRVLRIYLKEHGWNISSITLTDI